MSICLGRTDTLDLVYFHLLQKYFQLVKKSSLEHILFKCILFVFIMQTISDLNRYFLLCRIELYASFMADSELMLFGERLLLVRKKRKVSQDDLAKRLGVHAPVIGR